MGARTEKLLLEDAEELGYAGIRVDFGTGYGFHSPHDAGDLLIGKPVEMEGYNPDHGIYSDLYTVEEKYRSNESSKYIQADGEKTDSMISFAEAIGATPAFAVRWSSNLEWSPGSYHLITDARELEQTEAGYINITPEDAIDSFSPTEEFF